jgi:cobalt-zinc-cadmium efflux system outer membrane protein
MPIGPGVGRHRLVRAVSLCAVSSPALLGGAWPSRAQAVVPKSPLGRDLQVFVPDVGDAQRRDRPAGQNPTGTVSLSDVLALALLQNPALAAYAWETRAREARVLQAGRPPNPVLGGHVEDFGAGTLAGGAINEPVQPQATIQLSQLIELGGKRSARRSLADAERALAAWDYEAARIDVLTAVTQAFTDVLAAQATLRLTDDTTTLVEQVRQSVAERVAAGAVSPIEETRANVALAAVRIEAAKARRSLDARRTVLALLWGSRTPAFTSAAGDIGSGLPLLPPEDAIVARLDGTPELARWATELVQREAALAVERSRAVPDVSIVAGYRRFTSIDSNAVIVGASIPLPLFDRNRGGIEEARSRLAKVHEERRAAEARVSAALAAAYAAMAAAHDEIATLRSAVIPGSQEAFDAVTEGYRLGRFGLLDVLEAQRTLLAGNSQYLRALAEYRKAIANVERLIGAPLSDHAARPASARE